MAVTSTLRAGVEEGAEETADAVGVVGVGTVADSIIVPGGGATDEGDIAVACLQILYLHLLVLALLLVSTIIFFVGFVAMLIVFLLYLMMLTLHWEWGWSALALAAVCLVVSIVVGVIFRFRIVRPIFPVTFAEFQKIVNG